MNRIRENLIAVALLALMVLIGMPAASLAESRVEIRKLLDTAALDDPFVFDVDPGGAILILTRDNVFDAGAGKFLFGAPLANPAWLAFAAEKLQLIAGGALFAVDGGKPKQLLQVPLKRRIFVSDGERAFISGVTAAGKPTLFIYKEGTGHKALLELDVPIDAMALAKGALFFSAGSRIYTLREGRPAKLLVHLPGFVSIPSLAVDDRNDVLYFSEGEQLYALRGKEFVVVRRDVGGMLRWRNNSLYILSWRDHALLQMKGLSEAMAATGALVPLSDPCRPPVLSLYCEAEEKRAGLKVVSMFESSPDFRDTAARSELSAYATEQKKMLKRVEASLAKEAAAGAQAVLWGGGLEPVAIHAGTPVATEGQGAGLVLWDGSEVRIGPGSKAVLDRCGPAGECRQTLEKGLLYFEPYKPPVEGMAVPPLREYLIATGAATLHFSQARLALFTSGDRTGIVVLDGRVKAVTPEGEPVILISGETLEIKRGERPGTPAQAELERLNKWWEEIR